MKQINGNVLELDLSDPELSEHFKNPYNYTKEIIEQFDHDIYKGIVTQTDKIILDIGANVGLFAFHTLPYYNRIVCVEPTPSHFSKLKKVLDQIDALSLNSGYVRGIQAENSALNSYTGKAKFHTCGINTTMNSLHYQNRDAPIEVDCITLADLLDKYNLDRVDLCKIDIEGGEDIAITTDLLKACNGRIKKVFIELHPGTTESQDKFTKIFEDAGFVVKKNHNDALICTHG